MTIHTTKNAPCESPARNLRFGKFIAFCAPITAAALLGTGMLHDIQLSSAASEAVQCSAASKGTGLNLVSLDGMWSRTSPAESPDDATSDGEETLWNPRTLAWLTPEQMQLLNMGFEVGYRDGGVTHAKLVQAVLLQETIAGQISRIGHMSAPVGKRSYGVMQLKVTAARDVLKRHPEFGHFSTDEELIARLVSDDEFNIRMGSAFLKYMRSKTRNDEKALVAYNIGFRASKTIDDAAEFGYVKDVGQYLDEVVLPFNDKFGKDAGSVTRM